jgi:hypothetical protein
MSTVANTRLAYVAICVLFGVLNPVANADDHEIPLVDGNLWALSSEPEKVSYIFGAAAGLVKYIWG